MEETRTFRSPCEVIEIRRLTCSRAASLEGRPATQSGMDTPLVIVVGESIQLAMEIETETVPEEGLVEILAPNELQTRLVIPLTKKAPADEEADYPPDVDVDEQYLLMTPQLAGIARLELGSRSVT